MPTLLQPVVTQAEFTAVVEKMHPVFSSFASSSSSTVYGAEWTLFSSLTNTSQ
jgi:hypothetical protein